MTWGLLGGGSVWGDIWARQKDQRRAVKTGASPPDRLQMVQAGGFELRSWGHGTLGLGVCSKCEEGRDSFWSRRGWDRLLQSFFGFALLETQHKTLSMLDKPSDAELHFAPLQVLVMSRNKVSWSSGPPLLFHTSALPQTYRHDFHS